MVRHRPSKPRDLGSNPGFLFWKYWRKYSVIFNLFLYYSLQPVNLVCWVLWPIAMIPYLYIKAILVVSLALTWGIWYLLAQGYFYKEPIVIQLIGMLKPRGPFMRFIITFFFYLVIVFNYLFYCNNLFCMNRLRTSDDFVVNKNTIYLTKPI